MKTKKHFLFSVVVIAILSVCALGEVELPSHTDEPVLLGQANPALAGIGKLYVVIVPSDVELSKDGLVWKELEAKLINKLHGAGIKIMAGIAGNILNIDELRVYIDMLRLADPQQYVFHIQISAARKVALPTQPQRYIKTNVWKTTPVMQAVSVQNMPAKVTDVVLKQVEAFAHAYLAANPKVKQLGDTNEVSTVVKKWGKPGTKPAEAKYKYVASKNSKVFHKPDCSSAKRISLKNLVSYNSRDEAIKAGKRPCKRCKP